MHRQTVKFLSSISLKLEKCLFALNFTQPFHLLGKLQQVQEILWILMWLKHSAESFHLRKLYA